MWPAQLFEASIGMCIGGYVAKFCKEQGIPYEDITIELSRRIEAGSTGTTPSGTKPSHTSRIDAKNLFWWRAIPRTAARDLRSGRQMPHN